MSALIPLVALILSLLTLIPIVVAVRLGRSSGEVAVPADAQPQAQAIRSRAHRRIAVSGSATLVAGVAVLAAPWLSELGELVWTAACLAAVAAGCLTVAAVGPAGEPPDSRRSAELTVRTGRGFGPRWAFPLPSTLAVLLAGLGLWAAWTSSTVDGSPVLAWEGDTASGWVGPYVGWPTALVLLVATGVALAAFLVAVGRVARWPRPMREGLYALDDEVRRTTVRTLLLGSTGGLIGALGGLVTFIAGSWVTALSTQRGSALTEPCAAELVASGAQTGGLVAMLLGLVLMGGAAVAGHVRAPRVLGDAGDPAAPLGVGAAGGGADASLAAPSDATDLDRPGR